MRTTFIIKHEADVERELLSVVFQCHVCVWGADRKTFFSFVESEYVEAQVGSSSVSHEIQI